MASKLHSSTRTVRHFVSGTIVALLAVILLATVSNGAGRTLTLQQAVARDQAYVRGLARDLHESQTELRKENRRYSSLLSRFAVRYAALYTSSSTPSIAANLLGNRLSMRDLADTSDAINSIADGDSKIVDDLRVSKRRITQLSRRIAMLKKSQIGAHDKLVASKNRLQQAVVQARVAAAHAAKLARVQASPLIPRAVDPEQVQSALAASIASQTGESSGDSGDGLQSPGFQQRGIASVYANSFAGRPTASGEKYDPAAMTAAHPSLPLGTWVTVIGDGGAVTVRINDRGPYTGGRIIDLSAAAAQAIGLNGLGMVTIRVKS